MWSGSSIPTAPNWKGDNQLPGDEELYLVPAVSNTSQVNQIGLVDGNLVNLPTSYPVLNVATLNSTTINSTNINNAQNINTVTINGNPVATSPELWSLYPAVHNVVGLNVQQPLYVPRQLYSLNDLVSLSPSPPVYANYRKNTSLSFRTINPTNTLDPWTASAYNYPDDIGCSYNGVQYATTASSTNQPPPNASYWRLAEWDANTQYQPLQYVLFSNNWYLATIPAAPAGTSPPSVYWTLYQAWIPYTPIQPDPAFDITNFKTISSTNSNSVNMETANGRAIFTMNVGDSGAETTAGGALYVGKDATNTSQNKPVVQIGNATVGGSTVTIYGDLTVSEDMTVTGDTELKKTTIEGDTTITSEGGALYVNGGTTLDGGALTHGTSITALGGTIRLDVLPVGIDITSATGIVMNSVLLTEISGAAGAVLTSAAATSVSAGGALSLAGGSYIEYNTDQNYFINTSAGNDFTDIYVGNIHPAYNGSAPLRIGDSTGRGIQIDNGTTWNTENINVTNEAVINNLLVVDTTAGELSTLSFVNIPESLTLPNDWDGANTYELNALVIYAPTGTLYFSLGSGNQGNDPSTSPTFWLLANWDIATTYSVGDPTFFTATQNFWTSLQNSNIGNVPITPPNWDSSVTYPIGEKVLYQEQHFESLQNGNLSHFPDEVGSVWWTNIPIYWEVNTNSYNIGSTDTGLVFTPVVPNSTGITTLVKRVGDPNEELNVIVKNTQGVELSAQSVVVSPMYKTFDMGNQDITNVKDITAAGNISITAPTGDSYLTASGTVNVESVGGATLNSSTANVAISAQQGITITSTASSVTLEAGASTGNISILSPAGDTVIDANGDLTLNSATGSTTLEGNAEVVISSDTSYVSLTAASGQNVKIQSPLDMSNKNITGGNTITGTTTLTLATTGNNNLNLSPAGTGLIVAGKGLSMGTNSITNCLGLQSATGLAITTLSGTIDFTPSGTNRTNFNTDCWFNNKTLYNFTGTNVGGIYGLTTTTLNLIGQQATPAVTIRGSLTMWATASTQAPGNSIAGLTTLTGQTTLTLATLSNSNLSLSPNGTGTIIANKTLNMNNNNITNANTITGQGALTLTTSSNNSLFLSADGSGQVVLQRPMSMNGNSLQANYIFTTGSMSVIAGSGAAVTLTAPGGSVVVDATYLNMANNQIINLSQINSRNLFAYGNFYNTATQTLGATNTATRVVMNTSLNNNLITLDTTTNIGRITFTNAGVYHVVWNAYLLHGSGGTAKSVIWIRLNGTDVAGSGKTENNDAQQNETNMTSSSMVSASAGGYIEFYWAANSTTVPLTAVAASSPYPATPSFSCSVSIVG